MTPEQLSEYDRFLDENDWDIYYWATQEETPQPSAVTEQKQPDPALTQSPRPGEWAQTVGTFKPAYRPVPSRWKDSQILKMLREHVRQKRAEKGGLGFMPELDEYKLK